MSWSDSVRSMTEESIKCFLEKLSFDPKIIDRSYGTLEADIPYKDAIIHVIFRFGGLNVWIQHNHVDTIYDKMYGTQTHNYRFTKLISSVDQIKRLNVDNVLETIYLNRSGVTSAGSLGT